MAQRYGDVGGESGQTISRLRLGRRANPQSDFVVEAVQVAKAVRKPVKVVWTREDDIKGGYYRPMWYDRIAAGLDSKNNLIAWQHTIVGQSILKGSPFEEALPSDGIDDTSVEGAEDIPMKSRTSSLTCTAPK